MEISECRITVTTRITFTSCDTKKLFQNFSLVAEDETVGTFSFILHPRPLSHGWGGEWLIQWRRRDHPYTENKPTEIDSVKDRTPLRGWNYSLTLSETVVSTFYGRWSKGSEGTSISGLNVRRLVRRRGLKNGISTTLFSLHSDHCLISRLRTTFSSCHDRRSRLRQVTSRTYLHRHHVYDRTSRDTLIDTKGAVWSKRQATILGETFESGPRDTRGVLEKL